MNTVEFLSYLRGLDIAIHRDGDRLRFDAPANTDTPDLREQLKSRKEEILDFLKNSNCSEPLDRIPIERGAREGNMPLSYAQRRLWFLDQLTPGSSAYVIPATIRLRGKLDAAVLERSLTEVVRRHEVLRTVFPSTDGEPYLEIRKPAPVSLPVSELSNLARANRDGAAEQLAIAFMHEPFDLAAGPLFRARLIRLEEDHHILFVAVHHIVFDGWSLGVLMREISTCYRGFLAGQEFPLPELAIQYADFAQWQRRHLTDSMRETQLAYWTRQLGSAHQVLQLPLDRPRPLARSSNDQKCTMELNTRLAESLHALSQREGGSLFMTLLSAFSLLLHRLSGQSRIFVGVPVAGRNRSETEDLIGFFINTVVMKAEFPPELTFRELLRKIRESALDAYAHQEMPFEELVSALDPHRDLNRTPLFQVFYNHLNMKVPSLQIDGVLAEPFIEVPLDSKFDLTFYAREEGHSLRFILVYNADLFDAERMTEFLEQYQRLLEQVCGNPGGRVDRFSLQSPASKRCLPDPAMPLAVGWQGAVHEKFAEQCARVPGRIAVEDANGELTYSELDELSAGLAAWLRDRGIEKGDVVAVCGHRSAPLVVALLGVLRAEAAFCILDPAYPALRLARSFEAVRPKGFLEIAEVGALPDSLRLLAEQSVGTCRLKLPRLPEMRRMPELRTKSFNPSKTDPESVAYVSFTSGTTGEPKCIQGTHRPLSHFFDWHCREFGLEQNDRFSLLSGLSHDPLLRDIFTPLWVGATLCVPDAEQMMVPGHLVEWIKSCNVTVIHLTPAMGALLAEGVSFASNAVPALPMLRYAFFGGDVLTARHGGLLLRLAPQAQIVNFYGASETPQAMAWHRVEAAEVGDGESNFDSVAFVVPIGRALPDVQILILDKAQQLVGVGELGEIYVRTPYLTRGYRNDEALTRQRFVANSSSGRAGDLMYRTGDLGRYRPDGTIEYSGRADTQIKVRGYRVELAEVESVVGLHPLVRQCVVVARKVEGNGGAQVLAYVVCDHAHRPAPETLRAHSAQWLPDYMLPAGFVFLDGIPLTPNGKVDREALPAPEDARLCGAVVYTPPRTELERIIAEIWSEVLEANRVGIFDNFFELGGHSLSATRLIARLKSVLQVELPLKSLFVEPTVAGLAKHLLFDTASGKYHYVGKIRRWNRLIPAQPKGSRTPLFLVAGYMDEDDTLRVLARIFPHLGLNQPVYGFQPRWLDGKSESYSSVEEVVQEFLPDLKSVQPTGPYLLGGDCVGGVIALEMARELLRQGEEVGLLVMLDTDRPTALIELLAQLRQGWRRGRHILEVIVQLLRDGSRSRTLLIRDLMRRKLGSVREKAPEVSAKDRIYRLRNNYRRMVYHHRVKKYPGRITLIVNEQQYRALNGLQSWLVKQIGWSSVAQQGLEIIPTPGDHWTRYTDHSKEFANRLLVCLDRAQAESSPRPECVSNDGMRMSGLAISAMRSSVIAATMMLQEFVVSAESMAEGPFCW